MRTILWLLIFASGCLMRLQAQNSLSGTVNIYGILQSQSDCPPTIQVSNGADFTPGMAILLIQMGNASIDTDDSNRFGDILDLNGSGRYEYNRIRSISGNELELEFSLLHNYTPQLTQVVGSTIYSSATVTSTLRPQAWNGSIGGVVFVECSGNLNLQADVDASGFGYQGGGSVVYTDISCSFITFNRAYSYPTGNWRGAPKGQGVAPLVNGAEVGRGPQANGGGGGNNHNSGGGGGALYSAGGQGGENNEPSFGGCDGFFPGLGGKPLSFSSDRLFLGGGGGAGHTNNNTDVDGGNGGGIIVLLADEIQFNGGSILANGQNGESSNSDGAGGGGAGGSVIVIADRVSGVSNISVRGGLGGDVNNGNQDRCFGPGGGGSGGLVSSNLMLNPDLNGGAPGLTSNSTSCNEGTNDATAGQNGRQEMLDRLSQGSPEGTPVNLLSLSADTTLCPNELLVLSATLDNLDANFQWQRLAGNNWVNLQDDEFISGATTPQLSLSPSSDRTAAYRFQIIPNSDCYQPLDTEPITIGEFALPEAAPTFTQSGNTVNFRGNATATENFFWFFAPGETSMEENPSFTFPDAGTYMINLIVTNDCGSETYMLEVTVLAPLVADIMSTVQRGCAPLVVRFTDNSTGPAENRLWTFTGGDPATSTESNPLVTFAEVGTYNVSLRISNDIMENETAITVEVIPAPVGGFTWEASENQVQFRNISNNAFSYFWDFGDGNTSTEANPIHTYARSGSYEVTLNTSNGSCAVANTQTVSVIVTATQTVQDIDPIIIYPNPTRDIVNLRGATGSQVTLYSIHGQMLQTWDINNDEIALPLQSDWVGTLLLIVEQENVRKIFRVVSLPE